MRARTRHIPHKACRSNQRHVSSTAHNKPWKLGLHDPVRPTSSHCYTGDFTLIYLINLENQPQNLCPPPTVTVQSCDTAVGCQINQCHQPLMSPTAENYVTQMQSGLAQTECSQTHIIIILTNQYDSEKEHSTTNIHSTENTTC